MQEGSIEEHCEFVHIKIFNSHGGNKSKRLERSSRIVVLLSKLGMPRQNVKLISHYQLLLLLASHHQSLQHQHINKQLHLTLRTIRSSLHHHNHSIKTPRPNAKPIQAPAAWTSFHAGPNLRPLFGAVVVGKLLLPAPVTAPVAALRTENDEVDEVDEELREEVFAANTLVAAAGVDPVKDPETERKEPVVVSVS